MALLFTVSTVEPLHHSWRKLSLYISKRRSKQIKSLHFVDTLQEVSYFLEPGLNLELQTSSGAPCLGALARKLSPLYPPPRIASLSSSNISGESAPPVGLIPLVTRKLNKCHALLWALAEPAIIITVHSLCILKTTRNRSCPLNEWSHVVLASWNHSPAFHDSILWPFNKAVMEIAQLAFNVLRLPLKIPFKGCKISTRLFFLFSFAHVNRFLSAGLFINDVFFGWASGGLTGLAL